MSKKLGWGILSTGRIAGIFAQGLARAENSRLVAVGSRTPENAAKFAAEHGNPRAHGSYEALLADPDIDAIYNPLTNHLHVDITLAATRACMWADVNSSANEVRGLRCRAVRCKLL